MNMTSKNQFEHDKKRKKEVSMAGDETSPDYFFITGSTMRQQLKNAIDLLPQSEVAAYKMALKCCPNLVETESNPIQFIQYTNYNYQQASKLICNYWNFRKEIFNGKENRWLRSVTDINSKTGALSVKAVQIANQYLPVIIPYDRNGCPIIYCDQTVLSPQLQKKMGVQVSDKLQAAFYLLHVITDLLRETTTKGTTTTTNNNNNNGFSIVHILTEKKPQTYPNFHQFFSRAIRDCFPIKMNAFHIVYAPILKNCSMKQKYVQETIPYVWQLLQQPYEFTNRTTECLIVDYSSTKYYAYSYPYQLEQLLIKKFHWEKMFLPILAGGTWTTEEFQKWNKLRMQNKDKIQNNINNNTILPLKHDDKKYKHIHSLNNNSVVVKESVSKHSSSSSSLLLDKNHNDLKFKSALHLLADTAMERIELSSVSTLNSSMPPVVGQKEEEIFFVCSKQDQSKKKKTSHFY